MRSVFYTVQKYYDNGFRPGEQGHAVVRLSEEAILSFESLMEQHETPSAIKELAVFIAAINSRWTQAKPFAESTPDDIRRQAVLDAFHMVRVALTLLHPIAPVGCEKVREHLGVDESLWNWRYIFEPLVFFLADPAKHRFAHLPPKADFFEKPACQLKGD